MTIRVRALAALLVMATLALTGCGGRPPAGGGTAESPAARRANGGVEIVASFYPLQWVAEQVAGPSAHVASLTKPGAEPHDLELSPRDVAQVADADLVVYLKGFQPAVDTAVEQAGGDRGFDVAAAADLRTFPAGVAGGPDRGSTGGTDPHFWLDPVRLTAVAQAVAGHLAAVDPSRADRYRSNASALTTRLHALDREYRAGLASCVSRDLVTSHRAFAYLAQRYGLTQVGITGLTPEGEPKATDLTAIADYITRNHVRTVYYETLVSPDIARTVAREAGVVIAPLDPIEGLNPHAPDRDYLQVMRRNLATLRAGQPCP
ncbi:MAG: metal ABC transporter substrate-binding protein [Frankiaceae bacterium]